MGGAVGRWLKYGLSKRQYDDLVKAANGRCPLCRRLIALVIDHDHSTGKVRGLLCSRCNWALGYVESPKGWLTRALAYLEEHRGR